MGSGSGDGEQRRLPNIATSDLTETDPNKGEPQQRPFKVGF